MPAPPNDKKRKLDRESMDDDEYDVDFSPSKKMNSSHQDDASDEIEHNISKLFGNTSPIHHPTAEEDVDKKVKKIDYNDMCDDLLNILSPCPEIEALTPVQLTPSENDDIFAMLSPSYNSPQQTEENSYVTPYQNPIKPTTDNRVKFFDVFKSPCAKNSSNSPNYSSCRSPAYSQVSYSTSTYNDANVYNNNVANCSNKDSVLAVSNLVNETENFIIKLLRSGVNDIISLLTNNKDALLAFGNQYKTRNGFEDELITLITRVLPRIKTKNCGKLFVVEYSSTNSPQAEKSTSSTTAKKTTSEIKRVEITNVQYAMLLCLLHLRYLRNYNKFSHSLRISLAGIVFKRFSFKIVLVNKTLANENLELSKHYLSEVCMHLTSQFNLRRQIIVFVKKDNHSKFLLQTTEQFDSASINYIANYTRHICKQISGNPLYKNNYKCYWNEPKWFLPFSFRTEPKWFFNCADLGAKESFVIDQDAASFKHINLRDFSTFKHNFHTSSSTYIMTLQSLFACSIVDVLNSSNCHTLIYVNLSRMMNNPDKERDIAITLENKIGIYGVSQVAAESNFLFGPDSKMCRLKSFFKTFENFVDLIINDEQMNMRTLFNFYLKVDVLRYNNINTELNFQNVEFYDIYFFTEIIYKLPLFEMFNIKNIENNTQTSKLLQLQADNEIQRYNELPADGQPNNNNDFQMIIEKTIPVFSQEQNTQFEMMLSMCTGTKWDLILNSLYLNLKQEHTLTIDFIIVSYFFFCGLHGLEPRISKEYLRRSCNVIRDHHEFFLPEKYIQLLEAYFDMHKIDLNECDEVGDLSVDMCRMLKHIVLLLMKNGHVTAVVGMLMRVDAIKQDGKLQRVIIYLCDLMQSHDMLTNHIKYILVTMMQITEIDSEENISFAIKCCFFSNIMIYFLFDFHVDTEFTTRIKYFIDFLNGDLKGFFIKNTIEIPAKIDFETILNGSVESAAGGNGLIADIMDFSIEDDYGFDDSDQPRRKRQKKNKGGSNGTSNAGSKPAKKKNERKRTINEQFNDFSIQLKAIMSNYIGFCFKKSAIVYAYDKFFYRDITDLISGEHSFGIEKTIVEPSHNAYWYRRRAGIYNSYTRAFEKHSPALFGVIGIENPIWVPPEYDFNSFDYAIKNKLLDTTLKAVHFLKVCSYNKLMTIMLGTIEDPTKNPSSPLTDFMPSKNTQIVYSDLTTTTDSLPNELYNLIDNAHTELNHIILWLYLILCEISKHVPNMQYLITHPSVFLSKMFLGVHPHIEGKETDEIIDNDVDGKTLEDSQSYGANELDQMWKFTIPDTLHSKIEKLKEYNRKMMAEQQSKQKSSSSNKNSFECIDDNMIEDDNNGSRTVNDENFSKELNSICIIRHNPNMSSFFDDQLFINVFQKEPAQHIIDNRNLWNEIEINGGAILKLFLLQIVSWFIRMGVHHPFAKTPFFKYIKDNQHLLYESLGNALTKTCGPLLRNDGRSLPTIFKIFCENTRLELCEDFNEQPPPGYELNCMPSTKFDTQIYRSVCDLIYQSQFNGEILVDLLKSFSRFQHRGNIDRLCTAFTNKTATGKSELMKMLCDQVSTTHYSTQSFAGQDLILSQNKDGSSLASSMNKNLLTSFEELQALNNEFKLMCGFGELANRKLYSNNKATMRINSHIIFSTNLDPKTSDAAVLERLIIFERKFQFVQCKSQIKNGRGKAFNKIDEVCDELGVQILLECLPRGKIECGFGYYLMMFILNDVFLYNFTSPVSLKTTPTLKKIKDTFIYNAQPARYILENNLLSFSYENPMPLDVFDAQATCMFKTLRTSMTQFRISDALTELKDQLSKYVDTEKNVIFVKFNKD